MEKDSIDVMDVLLIVCIITMICCMAYILIALVGAGEDVVLEGKVTKVNVIKNAEGTEIKYYIVYMNNETKGYKIRMEGLTVYYDLTVNSEMIIKIGKINPRLPVPSFLSWDEYTINSIVKIPNGD